MPTRFFIEATPSFIQPQLLGAKFDFSLKASKTLKA